MKPTPLQLKWVYFPVVSYEMKEDFEGENEDPVKCQIEAEVSFSKSGDHSAFVSIKSDADDELCAYNFHVLAMGSFSFDAALARTLERYGKPQTVVPQIAVNICKMLYASAKEHLASMTGRAPVGSVFLETINITIEDLEINSNGMSPTELIQNCFAATDEEVAAFAEDIASRQRQYAESKKSGATAKPKKVKASRSDA